ncbi:MAG TPA: Ni/Fe hydrogenase subunit alpha [Anaerolineae bacterium]|nr:Ni/Fe hydrogenase subunit alpha [Anaerolineae bacterium]HOQ98865.1 Ni/Fe hydrogenase subunit alpha [Anaerolineae bacterium]HPL28652.1 Ni/Fe hydrogenase subunit alpha [Anaerolineae bacterium]
MQTRQIEFKPMRIEGAMKVSVHLDAQGNVAGAHAHVLEFRGFEAFMRGRHVTKAALLTSRICGVCPIPHHLASLKAVEAGLGIEIPETARLLRELMLAAAHVADHILHLTVLAGPDILLADMPPEQRGLPALIERYPGVVKDVLAARKAAQTIVSALGTQGIHPTTGVPGGITQGLSEPARAHLLEQARKLKEKILELGGVLVPQIEQSIRANDGLGRLSTCFMGLVKGDALELYDGLARVVDPQGCTLAEFQPAQYLEHVGEKVLDRSYAKAAYLCSSEPAGEMVRVGPIAQINVAKSAPTEHANTFLQDLKGRFGGVVQETLALNHARYVALVYAIERVEQLLTDERVTKGDTLTPVQYRAGEGVGIVEAPRGLLIHHFRWDDQGLITMANIIAPTTVNSYAIDSSLEAVAQRSISAGKVDEQQLEHELGLTVRAYDPCLSCATHVYAPDADEHWVEIIDAQGYKRWI